MKITKPRLKRLTDKIRSSRKRMLLTYPTFALLLMYMKFVATREIKTISTDGKCIYFSPDYMDKLCDNEVDFIMIHLIMHIVSDDMKLPPCYYSNRDEYHFCCNINNNLKLIKHGYADKKYPYLGELCPKRHR